MVHAVRWYNQIKSYSGAETKKFPGVKDAGKYLAGGAAAPAAADDDDDVDLFGSSDEEESEEKKTDHRGKAEGLPRKEVQEAGLDRQDLGSPGRQAVGRRNRHGQDAGVR